MLVPEAVTPLEMAVSFPYGCEPSPAEPPSRRGAAYDHLKRAILPALERPPCFVGFPGDDASSLVLWAATEAAREHGLDLPIPMTSDFGPAGGGADEYQEQLVRKLGLSDWERLSLAGQLDLLGDVARSMLARHGLVFPAIAHVLIPGLRTARGGSMVDTHGMESAGRLWRGIGLRRAIDRRRLRRQDLAALAALAPRPLRRAMARRVVAGFAPPYLGSEARAEFIEVATREAVDVHLRYAPAILEGPIRRCNATSHATFLRLARDHDVRFVFPFMSFDYIAAIAREAGPLGYPYVESLVRAQAPEMPVRAQPAPRIDYSKVWWLEESLAFAERWDGTGLDESLVDPEGVRDAWRARDVRATALLHAAWLATEGRDLVDSAGAVPSVA